MIAAVVEFLSSVAIRAMAGAIVGHGCEPALIAGEAPEVVQIKGAVSPAGAIFSPLAINQMFSAFCYPRTTFGAFRIQARPLGAPSPDGGDHEAAGDRQPMVLKSLIPIWAAPAGA
jgi:hypothetical protein